MPSGIGGVAVSSVFHPVTICVAGSPGTGHVAPIAVPIAFRPFVPVSITPIPVVPVSVVPVPVTPVPIIVVPAPVVLILFVILVSLAIVVVTVFVFILTVAMRGGVVWRISKGRNAPRNNQTHSQKAGDGDAFVPPTSIIPSVHGFSLLKFACRGSKPTTVSLLTSD